MEPNEAQQNHCREFARLFKTVRRMYPKFREVGLCFVSPFAPGLIDEVAQLDEHETDEAKLAAIVERFFKIATSMVQAYGISFRPEQGEKKLYLLVSGDDRN